MIDGIQIWLHLKKESKIKIALAVKNYTNDTPMIDPKNIKLFGVRNNRNSVPLYVYSPDEYMRLIQRQDSSGSLLVALGSIGLAAAGTLRGDTSSSKHLDKSSKYIAQEGAKNKAIKNTLLKKILYGPTE